MRELRGSRIAGLGLVAAAILVFGLPGCGDDEGSDDIQTTACRLQQQMGDTDCNGTIDADADGDGIFDLMDRYPGGFDFGDDDGDGFANWLDEAPQSPRYTVSELIEIPEARDPEAQALEAEAAELARSNEEIRAFIDAMDREMEERESEDADNDGLFDPYDRQPDLHSAGDADNDGVNNHQDYFPLDEEYE